MARQKRLRDGGSRKADSTTQASAIGAKRAGELASQGTASPVSPNHQIRSPSTLLTDTAHFRLVLAKVEENAYGWQSSISRRLGSIPLGRSESDLGYANLDITPGGVYLSGWRAVVRKHGFPRISRFLLLLDRKRYCIKWPRSEVGVLFRARPARSCDSLALGVGPCLALRNAEHVMGSHRGFWSAASFLMPRQWRVIK